MVATILGDLPRLIIFATNKAYIDILRYESTLDISKFIDVYGYREEAMTDITITSKEACCTEEEAASGACCGADSGKCC
jgi:hypothetical protein